LLFPNGVGHVEYHFLRKCESIARRAGFANWEDFDLHRWRKTGATKHHHAGVSVRTIQAWLGHESLEVTLDYLGVDDAASESSQQQVNNGALAAFVQRRRAMTLERTLRHPASFETHSVQVSSTKQTEPKRWLAAIVSITDTE
jgi:integrase